MKFSLIFLVPVLVTIVVSISNLTKTEGVGPACKNPECSCASLLDCASASLVLSLDLGLTKNLIPCCVPISTHKEPDLISRNYSTIPTRYKNESTLAQKVGVLQCCCVEPGKSGVPTCSAQDLCPTSITISSGKCLT